MFVGKDWLILKASIIDFSIGNAQNYSAKFLRENNARTRMNHFVVCTIYNRCQVIFIENEIVAINLSQTQCRRSAQKMRFSIL